MYYFIAARWKRCHYEISTQSQWTTDYRLKLSCFKEFSYVSVNGSKCSAMQTVYIFDTRECHEDEFEYFRDFLIISLNDITDANTNINILIKIKIPLSLFSSIF
jgi:hypothetical protein